MPCLLTAIQLSLLSTNLISHEFILDIYILHVACQVTIGERRKGPSLG